ncbi:MAG: DUF4395 domain-containing protein [Ignavibacteriaceae bacterium]|nr:DUF4395 domain-containing protein [Ignavibacteriaceae bacterium]
MYKTYKFGETVQGFDIPVLNEREIRAAAGIWFTLMLIGINIVIMKTSFLFLKYLIVAFFVDFVIRVAVSPKLSPSLILGRLLVRNQTPEYVGARQKFFAWMIGVILSSVMLVLIVIMNTYSPVTGLICFACLIFLLFESAFGICIGCKLYPLIYKEKARYCPGEVCDLNMKQDIQKTSGIQLTALFLFILFIVLFVIFFNDLIIMRPHALFGK